MEFTDEDLKEYLLKFFGENDQLPPKHIVAARFRITNHYASEALKKLENAGYLKKNFCGKYMFSRG